MRETNEKKRGREEKKERKEKEDAERGGGMRKD